MYMHVSASRRYVFVAGSVNGVRVCVVVLMCCGHVVNVVIEV